MIDTGATFCQVNKIMPDKSGIPCVTSGTQKWKGASPSLIARVSVIRIEAVLLDIWVRVHWFVAQAFWMMANIIIIDAVACVRKYLMADSVDREWFGYVIRGIIASVLISSPIHAVSQ